jgi:hypothetical protein
VIGFASELFFSWIEAILGGSAAPARQDFVPRLETSIGVLPPAALPLPPSIGSCMGHGALLSEILTEDEIAGLGA